MTYPDGTTTPDDRPLMTLLEARAEVRAAGGGTIRAVSRKPR